MSEVGTLLSQGLKSIAARENKTLGFLQEEVGDALSLTIEQPFQGAVSVGNK